MPPLRPFPHPRRTGRRTRCLRGTPALCRRQCGGVQSMARRQTLCAEMLHPTGKTQRHALRIPRRTPDAAALRSPVPTRRTLHLWPGRRRGVVRYRADRVGRRGFAWIRRKESAPSPRYGENGRPVPWFRRDGRRTALHAVGTRRPETGEHHGRD